MKDVKFPLDITFKIGTLSNDFVITDANQHTLAYVRQKMFKFVDDISVFSDDSKSQLNYRIKANKWIDFSASYLFSDNLDAEMGRVGRKGMASLWKAKYEIFDKNSVQDFEIREENPWAKVGDTLLGEIPILSLLTGYLFHPKYKVSRPDGTIVVRLTKEPSMIGRKFKVEKLAEINEDETERIMLSLMMMILLERRRG